MVKKEPFKEMYIELFSTSEGIYAINSPVRVRILSMLRKGELSFDQLVELSGKAKSTVSVHLKRMVDEGIIGSKTNPSDARKKIFFIKSEYLGKLSGKKDVKEDIGKYVSSYIEGEGDPYEFFRLIFHTIRVSLIRQGIDIDPILYEAGVKVGETLYEKVKNPDINKLAENIAMFWESHNLGHVEVLKLEPLTINVTDCFECKSLPPIGRPACAFDSGILKAVFSAHFNDEQVVNETKCYALGDNKCSFTIKNKEW
ncbi:V4R domain-containing protein [Methanobacterium sp. SMA-27]|uniref:V4R domain-containing protein n=1 Tax=Methanobacterium sp. SMA-27 TaxID=1495336 RepID=UPI00064F233C|nr:V4R domain-containing protein [Methanobacterium sp. SMA-27]